MSLEDGRFLVSPKRYEELRATHTPAALAALRLVPVHPGTTQSASFHLVSYFICRVSRCCARVARTTLSGLLTRSAFTLSLPSARYSRNFFGRIRLNYKEILSECIRCSPLVTARTVGRYEAHTRIWFVARLLRCYLYPLPNFPFYFYYILLVS